ncbi:PQ loop repeat-domain-containing protein [Schizophyllum commune]
MEVQRQLPTAIEKLALGWISIACWIIVYSPQLYENYTLQSGEGLSLSFVVIWLIGDLCNLTGAALGNLLPTVILLAVYYTLCDIALLAQVYYYRWKRARRSPESAPLLQRTDRAEAKPEPSTRVIVLRYAAALVFVIATGVAAWAVARWTEGGKGPGDAAPEQPPPEAGTPARTWAIQILGWTSAVLYLGARIPQIRKNVETRCDGLAPGLFVFSIFGNLTYALSICAESMDGAYLVKNASWLAGSALTVFLDVTVLGQFFYYRRQERAAESERDGGRE